MGSSGIRDALARGDVETADELLGRPSQPARAGGAWRPSRPGRSASPPPTSPSPPTWRPRLWRVRDAGLPGRLSYPAVTNIGRRPALDDGAPSIETFILDFSDDLYDQELRIELLARLRGEQKFSGVAELLAQIGRDVAAARAYRAVGEKGRGGWATASAGCSG
ncbi:MAG: riboflavin kinase [Dehalococcoidia bacterium]